MRFKPWVLGICLLELITCSVGSLSAQQRQGYPPSYDGGSGQNPADKTGKIRQINGVLLDKLEGKFSSTFRSVPIKDALRIFAQQFGLNIIVSSKIQANLTADFKDATVKDGFLAILSTYGLYYLEEGSILKVMTADEYKEELKRAYLKTRIYNSSIIDLKNLPSVLKPVLTPELGYFRVDTQSSSIFVTDIEENFPRIEEVLREVASVPKQVEIEIKAVQVSLDKANKSGIRWNAYNVDGAIDLNYSFAPTGGVADEAINLVGETVFEASGVPFDVLLSLLSSQYEVYLISQPRVSVINRGETTIKVGDEVPYLKSATSAVTVGEVSTEVNYVNTGIMLKMKPTITSSNEVKIQLEIEQSTYTTMAVTSTENAPLKTEIKQNCEVIAKNGHTIVIGGLVRQNKTSDTKSVPFLGRIPVLKYFFSHVEDQDTYSELVIFLTPKVISPE